MNDEILKILNELQKWRNNKKSKREPIPEYFWEKFRFLNKKYPDVNLRGLVKCNTNNWSKKVLGEKMGKSVKKNEFVLMPNLVNFHEERPVLKIKLSNGAEVSIYQ